MTTMVGRRIHFIGTAVQLQIAVANAPDLTTADEVRWRVSNVDTNSVMLEKTLTGGGVIVNASNVTTSIEEDELTAVGQFRHCLLATFAGVTGRPLAVGVIDTRRC